MFWTKDGPIPRPSDDELAGDISKFPCPCPRIYRHLEKTWVKPRTHTRPDCLRRIALEYQNAHGGSHKRRKRIQQQQQAAEQAQAQAAAQQAAAVAAVVAAAPAEPTA